VWALDDYGFRAVIAPSYADIFFSNCFKNGVLPVVLPPEYVQAIFDLVGADAVAQITIDLPQQQVRLPDGQAYAFDINPHHKHNLVNGLDEIGLTLNQADAIKAYEAKRRVEAPWLFS
jgi:3-isopropylmalate/(R)-2-methylmalate dehydratase small subunit